MTVLSWGKDDGRGFQGRVEGLGQEKADALTGAAAFFGVADKLEFVGFGLIA